MSTPCSVGSCRYGECVQRMEPNLVIDDVPTLRSDRQALQRSRLLKSVVDGPWRSRGTSLEVHGKKSPNKFTWFLEFFWIDALSVENYSKEISLPIIARGSTYLSRKSCPIPSGIPGFVKRPYIFLHFPQEDPRKKTTHSDVQGSNKNRDDTNPLQENVTPSF